MPDAEILGDTGENHPDNWVDHMANPKIHAIVIFFARSHWNATCAKLEHQKFVAQCQGVEILSYLDLDAVPPLEYSHDHFGYRDRLSEPPY